MIQILGDKTIIANWKMSPGTAEEAVGLLRELFSCLASSLPCNLVIAPPFVFLDEVRFFISQLEESVRARVFLGAQDVGMSETTRQTGEVSPEMLRDAGVTWVIVGHSERRQLLGDSDSVVAAKVLASLEAGLRVVLCVGESAEIRDGGFSGVQDFLMRQASSALLANTLKLSDVVIAYEPVWAIGTGVSDTPRDALEVAGFLKQKFSVPILYGGSVTSDNAKDFICEPMLDGLLVGGASLDAVQFAKIVTALAKK